MGIKHPTTTTTLKRTLVRFWGSAGELGRHPFSVKRSLPLLPPTHTLWFGVSRETKEGQMTQWGLVHPRFLSFYGCSNP